MDIALPALTIFIIVLPGIILKKFLGRNQLPLYRANASLNDVKGTESFTGMVLSALVPALVIHAIAVGICSLFPATKIRFDVLGHLLAGIESDKTVNETFIILGECYGRILAYFIIVCFVVTLMGTFCSWLIVKLELNLRFPQIFRLNPWYYYLSGAVVRLDKKNAKKVDLVVADVLTTTGPSNTLYSGIVYWYELSDKGIETLTLMGAGRWDEKRLVNLPGNYLVLKGEHILNLHFRYITVSEVSPEKSKPAETATKKKPQ